MKKVALLLSLLTLAANAIYPDDHWEYSTQLTTDNFDEFVQSEIDSGRTLFAPAWNKVVKEFASNPDVSFGDINLSEQKIRGNHNPGKGGWPTIRYFNKETGVEGAAYQKKTDQKMCDELGPKGEDYMSLYVEEMGKTSLCSLEGVGCNEKQLLYIEKMTLKTLEEQERQYARLSNMKDSDMKDDLKAWKNQRMAILKQFIDKASDNSATNDEANADAPRDEL